MWTGRQRSDLDFPNLFSGSMKSVICLKTGHLLKNFENHLLERMVICFKKIWLFSQLYLLKYDIKLKLVKVKNSQILLKPLMFYLHIMLSCSIQYILFISITKF